MTLLAPKLTMLSSASGGLSNFGLTVAAQCNMPWLMFYSALLPVFPAGTGPRDWDGFGTSR
ncbi:hypothetical protein E4U09_003977, partial [Claviceps aff. purpurea]